MVLIFMTGAVILALEVLSSRILTPYFGVSLYIWAGILSTTLAFLASGYYLGGYISSRQEQADYARTFYLLPICAAAWTIVSCAIYPPLFPYLGQISLIFGSFAASALLLGVPLVCLSAMNPLLIAMKAGTLRVGDSGAGHVFFVSTVGSVTGVLITAFAIIPNLTNFSALLWLGLSLCAAVLVSSLVASTLTPRQRRQLVSAAVVVGSLSGLFLISQKSYLGLLETLSKSALSAKIIDQYSSLFGNIKIVELTSRDQESILIKAFLQDGLVQNRTTADNVSVSMYTYVLDRLAQSFEPDARTALVLGLGAGIVPGDLDRRGIDVTVVDINPDALEAAVEHFGFDSETIDVVLQDARTYSRNCNDRFDVVVVDLYQGDSTPDYLLTAEFFADLGQCLRPGGTVVMNAFLDDRNVEPNKRLLATISSAFSTIFEFYLPRSNSFIVATNDLPPVNTTYSLSGVPGPLIRHVEASLSSGKLVTPGSLLGYEAVTDRQNLFGLLMASAQMEKRGVLVSILPAHILVN